MDEPLNLTIVYESGEDGWITVSIPEIPGVLSQGRTRKQAREMILSALNDWLREGNRPTTRWTISQSGHAAAN